MNHIRFKKNNLSIENILVNKLTTKHETPFYCYSLAQMKNNYLALNLAFKATKPIICFSIKSNSNIALLKELKKNGLWS